MAESVDAKCGSPVVPFFVTVRSSSNFVIAKVVSFFHDYGELQSYKQFYR